MGCNDVAKGRRKGKEREDGKGGKGLNKAGWGGDDRQLSELIWRGLQNEEEGHELNMVYEYGMTMAGWGAWVYVAQQRATRRANTQEGWNQRGRRDEGRSGKREKNNQGI